MTPIGQTLSALAEARWFDYKLLSSLASGVTSRMIIVHGFVSYRVACRERAMQVFHEIAKTARSEPGCLRYDVFLSVSGGPTLFLLQEWENLDALTSHFRTEDMERLAQSLPDVIDGEINTRRFEIPDSEPVRRETPQHVIH